MSDQPNVVRGITGRRDNAGIRTTVVFVGQVANDAAWTAFMQALTALAKNHGLQVFESTGPVNGPL